jgi:hypothetical protein
MGSLERVSALLNHLLCSKDLWSPDYSEIIAFLNLVNNSAHCYLDTPHASKVLWNLISSPLLSAEERSNLLDLLCPQGRYLHNHGEGREKLKISKVINLTGEFTQKMFRRPRQVAWMVTFFRRNEGGFRVPREEAQSLLARAVVRRNSLPSPPSQKELEGNGMSRYTAEWRNARIMGLRKAWDFMIECLVDSGAKKGK